jgi:hypothetical protein
MNDPDANEPGSSGVPRYPGAPRWVKVLGLVALIAVVVFVLVHLAGGGFRGHGAH